MWVVYIVPVMFLFLRPSKPPVAPAPKPQPADADR